jgi:hypothetical protein
VGSGAAATTAATTATTATTAVAAVAAVIAFVLVEAGLHPLVPARLALAAGVATAAAIATAAGMPATTIAASIAGVAAVVTFVVEAGLHPLVPARLAFAAAIAATATITAAATAATRPGVSRGGVSGRSVDGSWCGRGRCGRRRSRRWGGIGAGRPRRRHQEQSSIHVSDPPLDTSSAEGRRFSVVWSHASGATTRAFPDLSNRPAPGNLVDTRADFYPLVSAVAPPRLEPPFPESAIPARLPLHPSSNLVPNHRKNLWCRIFINSSQFCCSGSVS